jgi:hypothetical protein
LSACFFYTLICLDVIFLYAIIYSDLVNILKTTSAVGPVVTKFAKKGSLKDGEPWEGRLLVILVPLQEKVVGFLFFKIYIDLASKVDVGLSAHSPLTTRLREGPPIQH